MEESERLRAVDIELERLIVSVNERNTAKLKPEELAQLVRFLKELRQYVQAQIKEKE